MYRMYGIVKKEWSDDKKCYFLTWLYVFYLRELKPLVLVRTSSNAREEKKAALKHIMEVAAIMSELLINHDNDPKKAALFKEAVSHHHQKIIGTSPLQVPLPVKAAIDHLQALIVRIRAIGH
jgi:hypothetical protein